MVHAPDAVQSAPLRHGEPAPGAEIAHRAGKAAGSLEQDLAGRTAAIDRAIDRRTGLQDQIIRPRQRNRRSPRCGNGAGIENAAAAAGHKQPGRAAADEPACLIAQRAAAAKFYAGDTAADGAGIVDDAAAAGIDNPINATGNAAGIGHMAGAGQIHAEIRPADQPGITHRGPVRPGIHAGIAADDPPPGQIAQAAAGIERDTVAALRGDQPGIDTTCPSLLPVYTPICPPLIVPPAWLITLPPRLRLMPS